MKVKIMSTGGNVGTNSLNFSTGLKHIDAGLSHEESPYGGVPMGQDAEGIPNLVEQNEVIYNDYVYSDRLKINKIYKPLKGKVYQQWEQILRKYAGKSYAEAIKKAELDAGLDERPNDPIARRGFDSVATILALAQEWQRDIEKLNEQSEQLKSISPEEYAELKELQEAEALAQLEAALQLAQAQLSELVQQLSTSPEEMQQQAMVSELPQIAADLVPILELKMHAEGGDLEQPADTELLPIEAGITGMEEAPHAELSLFNAGTPAEEMSTSELNETINEIIQYARENKDKELLKDARVAKRGSREAKEAFVDDAREDIQMTISEQKAALQERQQAALEELDSIEALQAAAMLTALADAGLELNALMQMSPELMAAMVAGQQFADGGDLNNSLGGNYSNGIKTYSGEPYPSLSEYEALNPGEKIALLEKYQMSPELLEKAILNLHWYDAIRLTQVPTLGGLYGYTLLDGNLTRGEVLKPGSTKVINKSRYSKSDNVSNELAAAIHADTNYKANTAAYIKDLELAAKDANAFQKMLQSRGVQWAIETDKLRGLNHAANLLTYDADGNPTGIKTLWSPKGKGYDKKEGKTYSDLKTYIEALRSKDPSAAHNDLDMGTRYIATDTDGKPLLDQNGNPIYLNGQLVKGPQYHILNDNNPTVNGRWQDYYVTVDNTPILSMPTETVKTNETPVESAPKADADLELDKFPKRSVWGDVGRIAALAGIAAQNIMSKPDYTHANAVASAARRPIRYVGFNPVGIRQAYNPADPFFLTHLGMALNRATALDLLNIGNGNLGAIAGNLIMNNYQSQLNQGQNYYQAHLLNTAQLLAANLFNAQLEQFNSNGLFNAGRANLDAYNQALRLITDADIKSAVMKQSIDDSKAKALSQGISGIVNGVSTMFDNDYNNKLLAWKLRHNKNPISQMDNTTANGGKLNRRKYKGFNL